MILSIIVAYAKDKYGKRIIGKNNRIPWHFPHDLERFKENTMGCAVIMGRKTHESIGRVLPGRDNIILTRQKDYVVPGAFVFHGLGKAIAFAAKRHSEVFIIGGQKLYEQTIRKADRLYLTSFKIDGIEGDAYFPEFETNLFKPIHVETTKVSGDCFRILQRKQPAHTYTQGPSFPESNSVSGMEDDWPIDSAYCWGLAFVGQGCGI
jgi:dihydrofolate reductase